MLLPQTPPLEIKYLTPLKTFPFVYFSLLSCISFDILQGVKHVALWKGERHRLHCMHFKNEDVILGLMLDDKRKITVYINKMIKI
jgi:hypothetical protein